MRNSSLLTDLLVLIARPESADGATLARVLTRLAEHELEEGGPYASHAKGKEKNGADLGLNLAIAVFLGMHEVRLPKLDAFIDACRATGKVRSSLIDEKTLAGLLKRDRALRARGPESPAAAPLYDAHEKAAVDAVLAAARKRLAAMPDTFVPTALAVIERTMRGNPDKQMSLMPLYMRDALGGAGKRFSDARLAELGLANVFFWTAFIIYDDFWDEDEAAEPRLLPVANLFARHYMQFFDSILPHGFFHGLMDTLDAANEWEMTACRLSRKGGNIIVPETLPDYGDFMIKFYPAAGHVLGPVSMLAELGHAIDSPEMAHLLDYFRYYLVAMQLNDDAHDWKEDLARGHLSTAVSLLLVAWKRAYPERREIDLASDMQELERLFWFESLVPLCEAALACTSRSRAALASLTCIEDPKPLERFIALNERIAEAALQEHRRSVAFLGALPA